MIKSLVVFFIHIFFLPLSLLWSSIYRLRRFAYNYGIFNQEHFSVPIISVGNLAFGGTGKTPFTLWLAHYFEQHQKKVMILTRGYKGGLENKRGILKSGKVLGNDPNVYGDEPILLSRKLKHTSIVVGKNRKENLRHYFRVENPDLVILDDGHQHLSLGRNINIVLLDTLLPVAKYKTAPLGYLRESFSALQDADVIVFGRVDICSAEEYRQIKKMIARYIGQSTIVAEFIYIPKGLADRNFQTQLSIEDAKGRRVFCASGIGNPESFYALVEKCGLEIIGTKSFSDHHSYTKEEINHLINEAQKQNAILLMTEKDMVKIRNFLETQDILYLEIDLEFISGKDEICNLIDKSCGIGAYK